MNILWMSDSPTSPSGFGNVTRHVCAGLAGRGNRVSILGWQAHGNPSAWQNCTLYPVRLNSFGADVLLNYLQKIRPDILITLADVWWLTYITNPSIANFMRTAGIPWALYYPIDGDMGDLRLPPSWVRILKAVDLPIAMSAYGLEVSRANLVTPEYIPHGVDTRVFCPAADKAEAKRKLDCEGRFVVLSDARNQPRKLLPRTLEIFRRFAEEKPDVLLHLHCDPDDPAARTPEYHYALRQDIAFLDLEDKVRLSAGMQIGRGLDLTDLAAIYQAADIHLLASWGEGFGLPTLQAASAGVAPMASDYTASRELVLGHGVPIRVQHFLTDQFGIRRALIDIDDAVNLLDRFYKDRVLLSEMSRAARRFAEEYDWEPITAQWNDLLHRRLPQLRARVREPVHVAPLDLNRRGNTSAATWSTPARSFMPLLPEGAHVQVRVVESKAGELAVGVLRDASAFSHALTIPVTLPPANPADPFMKARVTGCVYLASEQDAAVVRQLSRIFPGLNAWSTMAFELGPSLASANAGRPVHVKVVPAGTADFRRHLSASTLALDLAGCDAQLPALAAELHVPYVGMPPHNGLAELWQELRLNETGERKAARLARTMLTDQSAAAHCCALAHERLTAMARAEGRMEN